MHPDAEAHPYGSARRLSPEETERRRLIVRDVHHSNRIEGVAANPDVEHVFDAFIVGDIEADQIVPRLVRFHASA